MRGQRARGRTSRSGGFIGAANLAGRGLDRLAAFAQIVVVAYAFGASNGADTYFLASIVPLTIGAVVGEPVGRAFLTMLLSDDCEVEAKELAAGGLAISLGLSTVITAVYLAIALPLVAALHPDGAASLGPWLAFAPLGIATGGGAFLGALLLWEEHYVWAASRYPLGGLASLVLLAAAVRFTNGLNTVAAAVTLGYALVLIPLYVVASTRLGPRWPLRVSRPALSAAWRGRGRVGAAIGGGLIGGQVIVLVERLLAAPLGGGSVSSLSYARGVAGAPALATEAFSAGAYPGFARAAAANDADFLRSSFLVWFRLVIAAGVAFGVYFALFGHDVIEALLQRGRFGGGAANLAGDILVAFALSTAAGGAVALFVTALYGLDRFVGVLYREIAVLGAYAVLGPVLRATDGVVGLAWAFSIAQTFGACLAGVLVVRQLSFGWRGFLREGVLRLVAPLALIAAVPLAVRVGLDRSSFGEGNVVRAVTGGVAAAVAVLVVALLSPLPEARRLRRLVRGVVVRSG